MNKRYSILIILLILLSITTGFYKTETAQASQSNGTKIAFYYKREYNYEIYVMNADGSDPIRLTNDPAEDYTPDWSPDGTRIVFTSGRDGQCEIYVMNADGSDLIRLTTAGGGGPAWSPDGTKIAFSSERDGNFEVYVMNADGSEQTRLTYNPVDYLYPAWSPVINKPPEIISATLTQQDPCVDTIHYIAVATDSDDDIVSYEWEFSDGGTATGAEGDYILANSDYCGNISATLTVTDSTGLEDTDSSNILDVNQPPVISLVSLTQPDPYLCEIDYYVEASDCDGDTLSYSWTFTDDTGAVLGTASDSSGKFTISDTYCPGFCVVTGEVTVTDSQCTVTDLDTLNINVPAEIDIKPDIINMKAKLKWIFCTIELPECYDVSDIDISTILLNDAVYAESEFSKIRDYDKDGILDLMVKFNADSVKAILSVVDEVDITVKGELTCGALFEGTDTIKVIEKGKK